MPYTTGFNSILELLYAYSLVGGIGFSPHREKWRQFLDWIDTIDLETVDVSVPSLATSQWFTHDKRRNMWTQYYSALEKHGRLRFKNCQEKLQKAKSSGVQGFQGKLWEIAGNHDL